MQIKIYVLKIYKNVDPINVYRVKNQKQSKCPTLKEWLYISQQICKKKYTKIFKKSIFKEYLRLWRKLQWKKWTKKN